MKRTTLVSLAIVLHFSAAAQSSAREFLKDTSKYNFLVIDSRYQNQFTFWGRDYNQKLPFLATSIMYYTHGGIWMSASHFNFFSDNVPSQMGLTMGYFKSLTEKKDWHISYSQFYVPSMAVPSAYKTQGYVQTTYAVDWGPLFSSFQLHALINQHSDVFFTSYHSRYFVFNDLLWKSIRVSFEPKISFTMGTHNFEYANGLVIAPGGGGVISQSGDSSAGSKIEPLNFDFTFPLKFAVGYFSIEPSWKYTLPFNSNPLYGSHGLSLWTVGLNYYVPIRK